MTNKDKWVALFEKVAGRKPTAAEFMAGKESDFDLKQIRAIAGLDRLEEKVEQVVEPIPEQVAQVTEMVQIQAESGNQATATVAPVPPKVKKTLTKGQKVKRGLLGLGALAVLGLGGAYWYFDQQTGADVVIEQLSKAVESNDYDRVAKLFSTKANQWSKDDAKAFLTYLEEQDINPVTVLENLAQDKDGSVYSDSQGNKLLGLEEIGKKFGIFSEYQLATYPVTVSVKTNMDKLTVNDQEIEKNKEIELGDFKLAGQSLDIKGKTDLGDLDTKLSLNPAEVVDNQLLVNLEQSTKKLSVSLPDDLPDVDNIKLVINDKDAGEGLTKDIKVFDNQELKVHATFSYDKADYTTEMVTKIITSEDANNYPIDLPLSADVTKKITQAQKDKEEAEQEAKATAEKAAAEQAKQNAQNAQVRSDVEDAVNRYRSAINAVYSRNSYSGLADVFTSTSNSTYLELINDTIPGQKNEGLQRFEYENGSTVINVTRVEGDYVDATVTYNVTSHYNSGNSIYSSGVTRYYTLKYIGGKLYFESFNVK